MLIEKLRGYFPILVILFLLGGVYLGYANVWLCVGAFLLALTRLNKEEFVFFMLLGGAGYFGVVGRILLGQFTLIPQFLVYLIVLLLIIQRIIPLFQQNRMANYMFAFLLIIFAISYIYGPHHAYSTIKLIRILIYGLLCFWIFLIYNEERNIDPLKLAYLFALVGVTYIVVGVTVYHFGTPSSILDFNYFRGAKFQVGENNFAISYHEVGLAALYGVVFLLSAKDDSFILKPKSIFLLIILIYVALISQMRQGILGIFVLLFFRYILLVKNKIGYKLIGMVLIAAISLFMFNDVQSNAFESVGKAKSFDEAVNRSYNRALDNMDNNPFFGLGLGGYSWDGKTHYPHNIFLEIINELGFVGLLIIIAISLYVMWYNRFSWKAVNANNTYAILLLLAVFIRINASSDLTENILFFSLLFSLRNQECLIDDSEYS